MYKLRIFVWLVLLFATQLAGQEENTVSRLQVVGTPEPTSTILTDCIDDNEKIGAGLLIQTDLDGVSFGSANGIVHVNSENPGEYLLCLSTNERMVWVYKQGFAPLELNLGALGINFKPRQVWCLQITGQEKVNLQPVSITANVDSAVVYINDAEVGFAPITVELPLDSVSIRVTRPGKNFETKTKRILILPITKKIPFFLKPVDVIENILISSNAEDADIFIDGIPRGKTPQHVRLPLKMDLRLELNKEGYYPVKKNIRIIPGLKELPVTMQRKHVLFKVKSSPKGAEIYIDGKKSQKTTPAEISVEWGMHTISVSLDCYKEEEKSVFLRYGRKKNVEFDMQMTDYCLSQINYRKNWWGKYKGISMAVSQYDFLSESFTGYYPKIYGAKVGVNSALSRFFFYELSGTYFLPFEENKVSYLVGSEEVQVDKIYGIIGELNLYLSLPIGKPFRLYAGGGGQVGSITAKPDKYSSGIYYAADSTAFQMNAATAVAGLDIRLGSKIALTFSYKQTFENEWADYKRYTVGFLIGNFK